MSFMAAAAKAAPIVKEGLAAKEALSGGKALSEYLGSKIGGSGAEPPRVEMPPLAATSPAYAAAAGGQQPLTQQQQPMLNNQDMLQLLLRRY
jgi:hypothetical protein